MSCMNALVQLTEHDLTSNQNFKVIANVEIGNKASTSYAARARYNIRRRCLRWNWNWNDGSAAHLQLHLGVAGVEHVAQLGSQVAPRAREPGACPVGLEPFPPLRQQIVQAAPALRRRQVPRALRRGPDVGDLRVKLRQLPRREVHPRRGRRRRRGRRVVDGVARGGVEQLRDGGVVGGDVDALRDAFAADESLEAGVVGGGEEVGAGDADVALVVDERGVAGAVADPPHVLAGAAAAVEAVGGAEVAAAEDEPVDAAGGAGGEERGRGGRVGLEAEDEILEVGRVGAADRVVAAGGVAGRPRAHPLLRNGAGGEERGGGRRQQHCCC
ncbi:hypothetical protein U9M48_015491 [Paspalum notatum var. saurae]|uniref:Uncharacterized protein n=1 Tax=Paspalum notatum var. saurae TaxID=547442 RepID=A0AAQ3T3R8_PASNO